MLAALRVNTERSKNLTGFIQRISNVKNELKSIQPHNMRTTESRECVIFKPSLESYDCEHWYYTAFNPFMPSGLFYFSLDRFISVLRSVRLVSIITMFYRNSCLYCKQ